MPLKVGAVLLDGVGGWLSVTVGERVSTKKLTGALKPVAFPIELFCDATAVYSPVLSSGLAWPEVQVPPVPEAPALETTGPAALDPAWISIVTASVSPALPVNDGVVSLEGDFGWFRVTCGGAVSTVKVTVALTPAGLPSELGCVAIAVYWPSASSGLAAPDSHSPPLPDAVALETAVPPAFVPS